MSTMKIIHRAIELQTLVCGSSLFLDVIVSGMMLDDGYILFIVYVLISGSLERNICLVGG